MAVAFEKCALRLESKTTETGGFCGGSRSAIVTLCADFDSTGGGDSPASGSGGFD
jgi:hypothetical protein